MTIQIQDLNTIRIQDLITIRIQDLDCNPDPGFRLQSGSRIWITIRIQDLHDTFIRGAAYVSRAKK